MKNRKLKGYVLPTLYGCIVALVIGGIMMFGSSFSLLDNGYNYDYGISPLIDEATTVMKEDETKVTLISSPVDEKLATISIHYYSKDDDESRQESSLIYYENTYLPNTGILYTGEESFEVKSIYEGTVIDLLEDEFFEQCVVIEHTDSIRSYYYGLDDLEVEIGDAVTSNTILGTSKINEIGNNKNSFLLEVYYNNELINPEKFIGTKISDYE